MSNSAPTSPEPVRDELDQEGLQIAASAILDNVPTGYGMTRPEAIDYARAAILAYRECQWRPIETAQKITGAEIIGVIFVGAKMQKEPFITFWSPSLQKFYCNPTHWMPLPKAPHHA